MVKCKADKCSHLTLSTAPLAGGGQMHLGIHNLGHTMYTTVKCKADNGLHLTLSTAQLGEAGQMHSGINQLGHMYTMVK